MSSEGQSWVGFPNPKASVLSETLLHVVSGNSSISLLVLTSPVASACSPPLTWGSVFLLLPCVALIIQRNWRFCL